MQTAAPALAYATPTASRKANTLGMWVAHVMVMLAAGGVIEWLVDFVVFDVRKVFRGGFRTELPSATETVFLLNDWVVHPLGWIALAALALAVPSLVWALYRNGRARSALAVSMLLAIIAFLSLALLCMLALFLPFKTIMPGPVGAGPCR